MIRKAVCWIMFAALMGCMALRFDFESAHAEPRIIVVPDDYSTIQEAINNASNGDTVFVKSGIYYENIDVNKTVSLIGENRETTIIDSYAEAPDKVAINVTVSGVEVTGFTILNSYPIPFSPVWGVWLWTNSSIFYRNIVTGNHGEGILVAGHDNVISENILSNNDWGISVSGEDNLITGNIVSGNSAAPQIVCSSASRRNTIENNTASSIDLNCCKETTLRANEMLSLTVEGNSFDELNHTIDTSNRVREKPVRYWVNHNDQQVPSDTRWVALINCTRITVSNLHGLEQVSLAFTNQCLIENVTISGEVHYMQSKNNRFENSTVNGNVVIDSESSNNSLQGLNINGTIVIDNYSNGICINDTTVKTIRLWGTRYDVITNNIIGGEEYGIYGYESLFNNTISNNLFNASSGCGILLFYRVEYNLICGNTFLNNHVGIELGGDFEYATGSNAIFHNNFINNTNQVILHNDSFNNAWDNGCEGNYWSNHTGTDANGDGIGDTAHIIDANNTDRYPLMNRFWNPSDINHDLKIDMKDVGSAAKAFWTRHGNPDWNPHADITGPAYLVPDGKVDMRDIAFIARRFGEAYI